MASKIPEGFTLIELVVSVSLVLLLSGLLIAGYNGFNDSQSVKAAAAGVKSNLEAARTHAGYGQKPAGCDTLVGYQVTFPTNTTYQVAIRCVVSGSEQSVGTATSFALPPAIIFSPIPSPVTFYPLDGGASISQSIKFKGVSATATLTISSSGVLSL